MTNEQRKGKTGIWTKAADIDGGFVLATSEWGTNHEFAIAQWEALPYANTVEAIKGNFKAIKKALVNLAP